MEAIGKCLRIPFCRKKRSHNLILFLGLLPILLLCLLSLRPPGQAIPYPLQDPASELPYVQQADAFLKGQLHLDVTPSPELAALENPYDRAAREGVRCLWDRAYYDGHYYSYFGVAPIFTVYLPHYALFGTLPSVTTVCVILACACAVLASLAYRETVLLFLPHAKLWAVTLGLPAFLLSAGFLAGIVWQDTYYIAVLSAVGSLMGFLFAFLRALRCEHFWGRTATFALAALFLVLTVASRPTAAVMSLILLPSLAATWHTQKQHGKLVPFLQSFGYFLLPLAFGAALIMWYNYARFDSVLEFGARYQLTVSDVSQNTLRAAFVFPSLFSYFLQPPNVSPYFPFFSRSVYFLGDPTVYVYRAGTVGAWWFGTPLAAMLSPVLPTVRKHRLLLQTLLCGGVLALLLAFINYCLGGVSLRYLLDLLPTLSLLGTVVLVHTSADETLPRPLRIALPTVLFLMGALMCMGLIAFR